MSCQNLLCLLQAETLQQLCDRLCSDDAQLPPGMLPVSVSDSASWLWRGSNSPTPNTHTHTHTHNPALIARDDNCYSLILSLCHNGRAGVTQKPSKMPCHILDSGAAMDIQTGPGGEIPLLLWPLPGKLQVVSHQSSPPFPHGRRSHQPPPPPPPYPSLQEGGSRAWSLREFMPSLPLFQ